MIKKLEIKNFRCFENFTIDNLAPITVIGGSNNTGKSTLLEAILSNYAAGNMGIFWLLFNIRNGYISQPFLPHQVWDNLFFNKENVNKLTITSEWHNDIVSELELSKVYDSGMQFQFNEVLSAIHMKFESQSYNVAGKCIIKNDMMQQSRIELQADDKNNAISTEKFNSIFEKSFLYKGLPYDASLPGRISRMVLDTTKKDLLIDVLQKFDKSIVDIRTVVDTALTYSYIISENGKALPINYMGDGINKALLIVSQILNLKNGILLIDEIENGFYYELYEQLLTIFCETALKNNCQIIATTHNFNIIETFANVMESLGKLDDLCYQRIDTSAKTGGRIAKKLSGPSLKDAVEANMEVR